MTNLYAQDEGWHGYTQGGSKAHRIYRPSRFPKRLIACSSLPVWLAFRDDYDTLSGTGWCLHCYPAGNVAAGHP